VQDECEAKLPPLSTESGAIVRIPPELMPSDGEAMHYFDIYFSHIHSYVPVVHRAHLYQQWQNDKSSISPLLLEALFACSGRMSDDPAQGAQWLALANSEGLLKQNPSASSLADSTRTRACLHGSPAPKHNSSTIAFIESSRIRTKERLLLSILADCENHGIDGKGFRSP